MNKALIAVSAVFVAALVLYATTGVFDGILLYLQALPAPALRLIYSGAIVALSLIVLAWVVARRRRAGRLQSEAGGDLE